MHLLVNLLVVIKAILFTSSQHPSPHRPSSFAMLFLSLFLFQGGLQKWPTNYGLQLLLTLPIGYFHPPLTQQACTLQGSLHSSRTPHYAHLKGDMREGVTTLITLWGHWFLIPLLIVTSTLLSCFGLGPWVLSSPFPYHDQQLTCGDQSFSSQNIILLQFMKILAGLQKNGYGGLRFRMSLTLHFEQNEVLLVCLELSQKMSSRV